MAGGNPVDPLSAFVSRLESVVSEGDFATAATLAEENLSEFWYGLPLSRARELMDLLAAHGSMANTSRLAGLHVILSGSNQVASTGSHVESAASYVDPTSVFTWYQLRMQGRSHEVLDTLGHLNVDIATIDTLFDPGGADNLVAAVQLGVTAMLAGEYNRALTYFAAAQLRPPIPTVPFLTRDAYVKAAIIHAAYGDPHDAQRALNRAQGLPRSGSWAEPLIDCNEVLARALIAPGDDTAEEVLAIPLHTVGEMWPFYVTALIRLTGHVGRRQDIDEMLITLENLPLPRIPGQGLAGSIFQVSRCLRNLDRGDVAAARRFIERADPKDVAAQQCLVMVELAAGRFRAAQRAAQQLGRNPRAAGRRRVKLWSLAGLAESYLALGSSEVALEAMRAMDSLAGGMRPDDLRQLGKRTRELAAAEFPEWLVQDAPPLGRDGSTLSPVNLTEREYETLRVLAMDIPRTEMASELFISVNTLKGRLTSIYRKLGVTNRDAALLRAEREGWL